MFIIIPYYNVGKTCLMLLLKQKKTITGLIIMDISRKVTMPIYSKITLYYDCT